MNLKQLGILLVLVVVVGGAGLLVYRHQSASWESGNGEIGQKLLGNFPVNDVASISITQGTNELNLVKKDDLWRVRQRHDYPANYSRIRDFLLKAQGLKVVQSEKVDPSQLAALQLAPPGQGTNSATVVDFNGQNGKPIRTLLLGKPHLRQSSRPTMFGGDESGWPDGRFVRAGHSATVAVISEPLQNIEPKPQDWLDKNFVKIKKAKSVEVDFPAGTNSWKLARATESADWKLVDAKPGEKLDTSKLSVLSSPLGSSYFTDVQPGTDLRDAAGTHLPTVVKISTFDGFNYTMRLGQKTNDEYRATLAVAGDFPRTRQPVKNEKPADKVKLDKVFKDNLEVREAKLKQEQGYERWTYLLPAWTVDPLLKTRAELLVAKKAAKSKPAGLTEAGKPGEKSAIAPSLTGTAPPKISSTAAARAAH